MTDQIEFSSFYRLLHSIKEGDNEKIALLNEKFDQVQKGEIAKNHLEELGYLYLLLGIKELYRYTKKEDLKSIGLIEKEEWEKLSDENKEDLPIFLANKMIEHAKKNNKAKEISKKWNVREGDIKKHITQMARYITEGIIDVIE